MPRVVLFRTPATGDTYESTFAEAGYTATSISALSDRLLTADLSRVISSGAARWEAVVITSRRAAEAWVQAVRELQEEHKLGKGSDWEPWSAISVYTPGGAVNTVFDAAGLEAEERPAPGPQAVNAAGLAPLLVDAPARGGEEHRPYLVLTGDKTLPTLTAALREAGREVECVRVYETYEAESLRGDVERLREEDGGDVWVALFSPSSAAFVLRHLEAGGWGVHSEGRALRVAAIGQTTADALRQGGYSLDAVAETPDAEGLTRAIVETDKTQA